MLDDPDEFLQLMELSLDDPAGARIVQLCVKDHSASRSPHLHVQVHMKDRRGETLSSEWSLLNGVSLDALKAAAIKLASRAVRFHMHEDEPARKKCNVTFLESLSRCTHDLSADEASQLTTEGRDACSVCLVEFEESANIVCMPCDGQHVAHWACIRPWLQEAATCPECRFELPVEGEQSTSSELDALIGKSVRAVDRLRASVASRATMTPNKCETPLPSPRRIRPISARGRSTPMTECANGAAR